jgi:DNA-directed RNA polymerase subunit K/omega
MDETNEPQDTPDAPAVPERPQVPPIESRFLYVDVAALRAKQLRRGALPRLTEEDFAADVHRAVPRKAERVAMEEVRRGLVEYDVPQPADPGDPVDPGAAS